MIKSFAFATVALSMAGGALAQGIQIKGVIGGGLTFGGDTIADVRYRDDDDDIDNVKVRAGGLFAINGGIEVRFTDMVSAQALIGYHFDRANGSDGNVRFERYPLDLLGHFRVNDWFRVGGGVRYTGSAKIRGSGAGLTYVSNEDFKPTWGTVVEGEFFPMQSLGIKLRYVTEKFKSKSFPSAPDLNGSHGGIYLNYYFF